MAKIIRPTYPLEFSIGLLLLIFVLSVFISFEIFDTRWALIMEGQGPIAGMVLAGVATVIMALILWEEFLFPVRIKPAENAIVFRNHFTKLQTQLLIYCMIPVIVVFIYFNYKVSTLAFFIWAAICLIVPVAGKLLSGIRNYNDFLKLTNETIEYRNNEKEGVLPISNVCEIVMIRDDANVLHKFKVHMQDGTHVIVDLDEMELEAFLQTIDLFIRNHYSGRVRQESNPPV